MPDSQKLNLILASASPRRLELLRQIGVEPDAVMSTEIDESVLRDETPPQLVRRLAEAKALAAEVDTDALVIGADTVVACGTRILGKPADIEQARQYLNLISGRRHRVYGGVCLVRAGKKISARVVMTAVKFKRLSAPEIDGYLASDEWQGKAGAYAIQGRAGAFVQSITGSYANVVGLPLYETQQLLLGAGYRT
ncbi:MAG: Maf family protein [Proteobacteria bacterium]|nr:Maf family protein [Pseudomonadota bacterium]